MVPEAKQSKYKTEGNIYYPDYTMTHTLVLLQSINTFMDLLVNCFHQSCISKSFIRFTIF